MPTPLRVRRNRAPAIAWTPTHDTRHAQPGEAHSATRTPDLYLAQTAILEVDAHLRESTSPLPFGLLTGDLCISPAENHVYLLVDSVSRSRTELSEEDPYAQLAAELRSLESQQEKKGKLAIGWYVGGMGADLSLDSDVAGLHRDLFPEPRHVVLLRGEAAGSEHGLFLRFDGSSNNAYPIPFYELLPEHTSRKTGERRTAIRWTEYYANDPPPPLGESEGNEPSGAGTSDSRWGRRRLGASLETFRQAMRPPALEKPAPGPPPTSALPQASMPDLARVERTPKEDDVRPIVSAVDGEVSAVPLTSDQAIQPPMPEVFPGAAAEPPNERRSKERRSREGSPHPGGESPAHRSSSSRELDPPVVQPIERLPIARLEVNAAHETSGAQQVFFINGAIVRLPATPPRTRRSRRLTRAQRDRITSLLTGALLIFVLLAVYQMAY